MNTQYPLTLYFDASCALCNSEMQNIKIHDAQQRLILVDCSSASFDDTPFRMEGITQEAMMEYLHVRDNQGNWIKGVPAFELIYRSVGMEALAYLWGGRYTRPVIERLYPWVARHRQIISWTGISIIFSVWGKYAAHAASKRSQQCHNGLCSIKGNEK